MGYVGELARKHGVNRVSPVNPADKSLQAGIARRTPHCHDEACTLEAVAELSQSGTSREAVGLHP
jgi:hypothetical protein